MRAEDVRAWIESGLEIQAGFEVWNSFIREQKGDSGLGRIKYESGSDLADAIEQEEKLLERLADTWNPQPYFEAALDRAEDITRGSEHYVFRFTGAQGGERVFKATFPKKYGRIEYSPTIYLHSLRLVQSLVPVLDVRLHGVLPTSSGPSIVTSMTYIPGRHPSPSQVEKYLRETGWQQYRDGSSTLDYVNADHSQIIRDGHANNWIRHSDSGALIPIDISIEEIPLTKNSEK